MKALLLAGGTGTRLWPVSRADRPKQTEAIVSPQTLLQTTVARLREGFAPEDIVIATSVRSVKDVRAQLPEIPRRNIIGEPARRDTAAAIGYALTFIARTDPDATFVTVASDHHITDTAEYHRALRAADRVIKDHPSRTLLVGMRPTYPETGYGYIKTGDPFDRKRTDGVVDHVLAVERFVEKPDAATAAAYVAQGGYLWNATTIVARVGAFLDRYGAHLPGHAAAFARIDGALDRNEPETLVDAFNGLASVSIEHGILEKLTDLVVLPASFGWVDVGNWRTVRDILAEGKESNVVRGEHVGVDSKRNLIFARDGKMIATAGLEGMVIVDTEDVLLVCPQERAQDVKKLVEELKQRQLHAYL